MRGKGTPLPSTLSNASLCNGEVLNYLNSMVYYNNCIRKIILSRE